MTPGQSGACVLGALWRRWTLRDARPSAGLALVVWALTMPVGHAQTDPRTLPRWDGAMTLAGTWAIPGPDGAGGMIDYGGRTGAMGVSADGKRLYISCSRKAGGPTYANAEGWAVLTIPALGGRATVAAPCAGPGHADIQKIHPNPNEWRPQWGGVVEQAGRLAVVGYIEYDAGGGTTASHWSGTSVATLTGPVRISDPTPTNGSLKTGYVKSYNGRIPAEWQSLLGGDTFATPGYGSIVSRATYGPGFVVYRMADLTASAPAGELLLGCPDEQPQCRSWNTPQSLTVYNGSENAAGAFIVAGTRTIAFVEREAEGPTCYGYRTDDPALHGTPYPSATSPSPEKVPWCYSLGDPKNQKQPMGYPYVLVAKLYDLAELVAVKEGTRKPWDITPYAVVKMPGSRPNDNLYGGGGVFNDVTGEYYLNRGHYGDGSPMAVYTVGTGQQPPPTDPCVADPVTLSGIAWPGSAEGARSGRFIWGVSQSVATLAKVEWLWQPQRMTVTDSRGCSVTVAR